MFALKVALKRQQAAEDAIALGLASVTSGTKYGCLPQGPIFGMAVPTSKSPVGVLINFQQRGQHKVSNIYF